MADLEIDFGRRLQKLATSFTARLFRVNTGMAWQGDVSKNRDGSITLRNPRPLHAGMVKGGSDYIGWLPVLVTPAMVGKTVAVFTAVETKAGRRGATDEQATFIDNVKRAGGLAGVARVDADLTSILFPDRA